MKWEAFECDDCKQRFALEQKPDDEIEEPLCPACGSSYFRRVELLEERSPLQEIIMISGQLPAEVLKDINQRIGDWLAMGGKETDEYIEQQLSFAKRFV
jgi:NAD-dependent SIR2 family protein deacetylase